MKKLIFKMTFLLVVVLAPASALAGVHIDIRIPIPMSPALLLPVPPSLVAIPSTNVYVVRGIQEDIFFSGGWWWRPWQNNWYRSRHYDRGWEHYKGTPSFHRKLPSNWRNNYQQQQWEGNKGNRGNKWSQHRVSHRDVQPNWKVRGNNGNKNMRGHSNWQSQQKQPQNKHDNSKRGNMNHRR